MVEELAPVRDRRVVDAGHLNTLSTLHYIGAGLALLGLAVIAVNFAVFDTVMKNPAVWKDHPAPPPAEFFDIFKWVYGALGGLYGLSLVGNLLAGIYLRARKHRTFCFVVAALNTLHVPLGTVLGIFTIVVLGRDSVRSMFLAADPRFGQDR